MDGRPPRVLHVIDTLHAGGAERYFATIVSELARSGRVECIVRAGAPHRANPPFVEALREHALDFDFLGHRALYDPKLLLDQVQTVRRFGVDVIHSHLAVSNASSRLVAAALRKPHVSTVHLAPFPRVEDRLHRTLADGLTARLSTRVIGVSPHALDGYARAFRVPADRRRVILTVPGDRSLPAGFDRRAARIELVGRDDARIVLTVCRLEERKGIADLIAAAVRARERLPELRVVVAGRGPDEDRLRRLVAEAGAQDTVRLVGFREDVGALLAASDVFCLPSYLEGLPVSILEAMQAGVPCVATDVGGTSHIVRDGDTGLLVPPRDPVRLADALESMLVDAELAGRVTRSARQLIARCCTTEVVVSQHADLYQELVRVGRRR